MKNLKDRPFALIGVNIGGHDAPGLKKVVDREKLTWRSIADAGGLGQGEIANRWNVSATPTLYLIDRAGIIRKKWVGPPGEPAIEAAIDRLIHEAERARDEAPRDAAKP